MYVGVLLVQVVLMLKGYSKKIFQLLVYISSMISMLFCICKWPYVVVLSLWPRTSRDFFCFFFILLRAWGQTPVYSIRNLINYVLFKVCLWLLVHWCGSHMNMSWMRWFFMFRGSIHAIFAFTVKFWILAELLIFVLCSWQDWRFWRRDGWQMIYNLMALKSVKENSRNWW